MLRPLTGQGGNTLPDSRIIVRRTAAIGDVTAALCVVDKLVALGYPVEFQAHPDIHCVLRKHGRITAISTPGGFCHVNLDGAYETHAHRKTRHFSDIFLASANSQLAKHNINLGEPLNCTPKLYVSDAQRQASNALFSKYPKPWVFICPRSQAFFARTIPDDVWGAAADKMEGTKFWLGMHPAPPNIIDLHAQHLDNVINWLSIADMLVTTDTGPMHIAAALGVPIVAILQASSPELHLTDQRDFTMVKADGLSCLNCQLDACPINYYTPPCQKVDPERIAMEVNRRLRTRFSEDVSAIVTVYKPDVSTVNRCLECLVPQVDEIIVSAQGDSLIPRDLLVHPKIKVVRKPVPKLGFGRNMNFGARHSNGKWLLLMNDDVFLDQGAVDAMKRSAVDGVGIVSNLLHYPDRTIFHAGKFRTPGVRGWGHLDYKQKNPTLTSPTEVENACGACLFVRRSAHFEIGGYDEEFYLFAEDDDYCLRMRKYGYKIMFTPHSTGIHMEHQSVSKVADLGSLIPRSNAILTKKWSAYLDHNLWRVPGNYDYLKV